MVESTLIRAVAGPLAALRSYGVVPQIRAKLLPRAEQTGTTIRKNILEVVTAYSESANPDILPELEGHLAEHVSALSDLLSAGPANLDFVRRHAGRCAAQKFPLIAVLAAYRCAHKAATIWIRDAALESADESAHMQRVIAAVSQFVAEYIDAASAVITSEYVAKTRALAEAEGDQRTQLFSLLLSGYDESDGQAAQLLRRTGYLEQRQSFCVVVAQSVNPVEMESTARAERMADAVAESLQALPVRVLVGMQDNMVTLIVSGTRRQSGWTAPQSLLADRIYPQLRTIGPAALIGVSADAPSSSHIPAALREAQLALDCASVVDRVMPYSRIPFRDLLVKAGASRLSAALPAWVKTFLLADAKSKHALSQTLVAYADANMNALQTAKALTLHPNTVYARMQRIKDLTERNPLSYHELTELLLATDCAKLTQ